MKNYSLILSAFLIATGSNVLAADSDKSQYTLFNPTPRDQMRKFSTDITMFTLNPYTVDAGHFQIEADFFDYIYDKQGNDKSKGWIFGWSDFKVGLCNRVDLEIGINAFTDIITRNNVTGTKTHTSGFSDIDISSKINIWGNDEGTTALAILPYVTERKRRLFGRTLRSFPGTNSG